MLCWVHTCPWVALFTIFSQILVVFSQEEKPLYIRISETTVFTCPRYAGLTNKRYLELDKNSIRVTDADRPGQEVDVIKLPGKYQLEFHNVKVVGKDLEYLVGDINSKLRAKLFGSFTESEIRVIPTEPQNEQEQRTCPRGGILVQTDYQKYSCRHCDLCDQSRELESSLGQHKILPDVDGNQFSTQCTQFKSGQAYDFFRVVELPDPNRARSIIDNQNLLSNLQNAFATGKGRMLVELRLLNKPTAISKDAYCQDKCGDKTNYVCWHWYCENDYDRQVRSGKISTESLADTCVRQGDGTELAACYDIEFSYDASRDKHPPEAAASGDLSSSFAVPRSRVPSSAQVLEDLCSGQPSWCRGCWWCGQEWCTEACKNSRRR